MNRLALVLLGLGLSGAALANPTTMAHQGRLLDGFGVPIDGPHDLTFRLYNTAIGGTSVWSETLNNVNMNDGYFAVYLGNNSPLDGAVFDGTDQWLAVAVDTDPELSSRKFIAAVPYAARAASVDWSDISGIPADLADGDDVLTEADVEGFVTNDALDLAVGTTLDGVDIASLGNTDWPDITSIPTDLADGDDVLTEGDVEGFVTNGAVDLHGSSTIGGASIAALGNTAQWSNITGIPSSIANGDQTLTEAQVEAFVTDDALDFAAGSSVNGVDIAGLGQTANWATINGIPADIADGDAQRSEAAVEGFITNGAINLHGNSMVDGTSIASLGNTAQWSNITGIPSSIANGDQTLTEAQVEAFVTDDALDLAAGTSVDGVDIAGLGQTANWATINGIPADIADGDAQRSEATVEGFITNGAIDLHGSSTVGGSSIAALGNTAQWSNITGIPSSIANGDQTLTEAQVEAFVTDDALDLAAGTSVDGVDIAGLGQTANWASLSGIPADIANGDQQRSEATVEGFITNGAINLHGSSTVGGASIAGLGNTAQWSSISGIPADIANGDDVLSSAQVRSYVTSTPISLHQSSQIGGLNLLSLGNSAQWNFITGVPAGLSDGDDVLSQTQVENFITNGAINLAGGSEVGGEDIADVKTAMVVHGTRAGASTDHLATMTSGPITISGSTVSITPRATGNEFYALLTTNVRSQYDPGDYCQFTMYVNGGGYNNFAFASGSTGWQESAHQQMAVSGGFPINQIANHTVWVEVEALEALTAGQDGDALCRVGDRALNSMMIMEME